MFMENAREDYQLLPICIAWPAAKTHKNLNFSNFSQQQKHNLGNLLNTYIYYQDNYNIPIPMRPQLGKAQDNL